VPIIGGFMSASFASGRTAGRLGRQRQLRMGLTLMIASAATALVLEFTLQGAPRLVQQVLLFGLAFGAQFSFPILTLEMLDLFPHSRGAAASVQSFIALGFISIVMGFVAPLLEGRMLRLDAVALAGALLAFTSWRLAVRRRRT
jgi:DHA1 family bicyclomycin/chloramphenicol resistance-like MFS transporter